MENKNPLLPIRQQRLEFEPATASAHGWRALPQEARAECEKLLAQLLQQTLYSERSLEDERKNS